MVELITQLQNVTIFWPSSLDSTVQPVVTRYLRPIALMKLQFHNSQLLVRFQHLQLLETESGVVISDNAAASNTLTIKNRPRVASASQSLNKLNNNQI